MTSHRSDEPRLFWEDFRRFYPVKAFAIAVIIALTTVSCGKEASMSVAMKNLNYDSLPADAPRPTKPAEKLHAAVVELKELLEVQSDRDLSKKQSEQARKARSAVAANLAEVEKQFAADRKKLGNLDAKAALKRLAVIETKTDEIKSDLIDALAVVPKSGEKTASARAAIKQLTALSPDKPQQPLSSDLSFGIKNAKPRSVSLSAGITPAYQAPSPGTEPSTLPREPEPADLEETDETKITPAIEQLATELDHDPVKIYEYVRNNIKFEPYYGIRKGADQTLAEKAGSDADQAALLIALMRESGVPARFVQGVAELPAAKAANWLGVDVANGERMDAVPEILWSGGVPTTPIRANGELKKVQFGHFWAEALVNSEAYRGIAESSIPRRWQPLDPSVKSTVFTEPVADFESLFKPAINKWINGFSNASASLDESDFRGPEPAETLQLTRQLIDEIESMMSEQGINDESTISDVVGSRTTRRSATAYLPASTPFRSIQVNRESHAVDDSFHAHVSVRVGSARATEVETSSEIDFTSSTADLVGARVTISYSPAEQLSSEVLDAYSGVLNAPSYSADLVPVLRVDGRVVDVGDVAVNAGFEQDLRIIYRMPGFAADVVENPLTVGSLVALTIDAGNANWDRYEGKARAIVAEAEQYRSENLLTDRRAGSLFGAVGDFYFARNNFYNAAIGLRQHVAQQRTLSGAIVGLSIAPSYVGGFPVLVSANGLFMDVDNDSKSVVSLRGGAELVDGFEAASGMFASSSEGEAFSSTLGGDAVSTARVFRSALERRIPIARISQGNMSDVAAVQQLSPQVWSEISHAVAAGSTVTVPLQPVTVGGWIGSGYLIERGGGRDYRITGGLSGSFWEDAVELLLDPAGTIAEKLASQIVGERAAACASIALDAVQLAALPFLTPALIAGVVVAPGAAAGLVALEMIRSILVAYFVRQMILIALASDECKDEKQTEFEGRV